MQGLAELVESEWLHVIFDIRRVEGRIGAGEGAQLRGCHRHRTCSEQGVLEADADLPQKAVGALVEGRNPMDLVGTPDLQVVLQVFADPREVVNDVDPMVLQERSRTDTRELQQLRGADRSGRENDLRGGVDHGVFPVQAHLEAGRPSAVDADLLHLGVDQDAQVGTASDRAQKGLGGAPAPAPALVDVEIPASLVVAAVEIVGLRDSGLRGGIAKGVQNLPTQPLLLDPPFAAGSVHMIGGHGPLIFGLQEVGEDVVPTPARIAELAPVIIVPGLAPHIDHAVDGRTAAEHASPRVAERAAVEAGLGLRGKPPVGAGVSQAIEIADRDMDPDVVVLPARLQKGHRRPRVFR